MATKYQMITGLYETTISRVDGQNRTLAKHEQSVDNNIRNNSERSSEHGAIYASKRTGQGRRS